MNSSLDPKKTEALLQDPESIQGSEVKAEDLPLKKRIFYAAMIKTMGNISQSCMVAGIKRVTYRKWLHNDPAFYELIEGGDFQERLLDFAESKLVDKINSGDIIAILFFLKTKGKKRGYIEGNALPPPSDIDKTPTWFDEPKQLATPAKQIGFEEAVIISESKNDNEGSESTGEMDPEATKVLL